MNYESLLSATLILISIAFFALEVMTNNMAFWMLGIGCLAALVLRIFDLEHNPDAHSNNLSTQTGIHYEK